MIYTLTLNPALDYILHLPDLALGEVNRTSSETLLPGGKGINVSLVLSHLDIPSVALGFTAGFTGEVLKEMLKEQGISCNFIPLPQGFTRINVKLKASCETEVNGRGPVIDADALKRLYAVLDTLTDGDILVLAGSVPGDMPDTLYKDMMQRLKDKKLSVVVDATGTLLTNTLPFHPFLIKPNFSELQELFQEPLKTHTDLCRCGRELQRMGARNVLISLGGDGALLLTEDGQELYQSAPKGRVINTTGSGDSMVAGFLTGFLESGDYRHALRLGVCAGSASAFSENLATKDAIRNLERGILKDKQ